MSACPDCAAVGRPLPAVTLHAHTAAARLATIAGVDGWRVCPTPACRAIYYRGAEIVERSEALHLPSFKTDDVDRLVCFCFGHTAADIAGSVSGGGTSELEVAIRAACKEGRQDCTRRNPQGRCCLAEVGTIVRPPPPPSPDQGQNAGCCAAKSIVSANACSSQTLSEPAAACAYPPTDSRRAQWAAGGAVGSAILSSACCWLPLGAAALGVSSAGLGSTMAAWRGELLGATALLLGGGFYLAYRPTAAACAADGGCPTPVRGVQSVTRAMLWMSAAGVAVFAAFPYYAGSLAGDSSIAAQTGSRETTDYAVGGMTCRGCEAHAREALLAVPGVVSVAVSYADGRAAVEWSGPPDHRAVGAALDELGYVALPRLRSPAR